MQNAPRSTRRPQRYRNLAKAALLAAVLAALAATGCTTAATPAAVPQPAAGPSDCPAHPVQALPDIDQLPLAERGPYTVGVRTIEVNGNTVEVWYPADNCAAADSQFDGYDMARMIPAYARAIIPNGLATFVTKAVREAPIASGQFPLVIFSHGFAGYRQQSTAITTHLASYGMVVASPEYPNRDLHASLSLSPGLLLGTPIELNIARNTLDRMVKLGTESGFFGGHIDTGRIAAIGHSAGGLPTSTLLTDDRVDTAVMYAAFGLPSDSKPVLSIFASDDQIAQNDLIQSSFASSGPGSSTAVLEGAGHLAFTDICRVGQDHGGIVAIADAQGLPVPGPLRTLASDGCQPGALPIEQGWAQIVDLTLRHLSTVWGMQLG